MQIDRPITIALTLFVIVILMFFFVVPEYHKFQSLRQELGEKIAEFNAEHDYYNAIDTTYYQLQTYKDSIAKIDDALPTDSNLGRLVYFIQKTGGDSGVIVNTLFLSKSSSATPGQSVKGLGLSLNVLGSYASLGNFIRALEKSSRLFEVTSISFSSSNGTASASSENKTQFQVQQIYSFNLEVKTNSY